MVNWQQGYRSRTISMEEAAQKIKSNDTLFTGLGMAEPSMEFVQCIVDRRGELRNVKIFSAIQIRPYPWYQPGMEESFTLGTSFATRPFWQVLRAKRGDFLPMTSANSGMFFQKDWFPLDVYVLTVTPPSPSGYVNLGLTNFYSLEAIRAAKLVIAEVNSQMPVIHGDNWVHVSEFDYFVEHDFELPKSIRPEPGPVEKTIAGYALELIKDRDTIQFGIGGVPEAIVRGLEGKNDLGIFSEMLPGGLPYLVEAGIVTNRYKPVHTGRSVATFCLGDQEMYDFVNDNPLVEFYPSIYTNSIETIIHQNQIVSINGACEVDCKGQVCAESIGPNHLSGPGGQLDFFIGALFAKNGRAINVLPSTRKVGDQVVSCIVPLLSHGASVTVTAAYTQYVITEYGIADLRGKTYRQRVDELTAITHPDFRAAFKKEALKYY
jgi:4-hydroxybutyrate CoA-transferase